MTQHPLPAWPSEPYGDGVDTPDDIDVARYERAMKEAYASRLRVAVEALKKRAHHYECDDPWYSCPLSAEGCPDTSREKECICGTDRVIEALTLIGPLPEVAT